MSDIDVGILPRDELPAGFFATLAEAIEESTIPYNVDIVDLREVDAAWLGAIRREGVQWRA